ncbi:MAG: hypothetical protein N2Z21_11385, partial [Candidatus Sumerlaeaceae bacterium]|nr:hypothetical protein [Candidatus Sumerlaeaceae bacterium]
MCIRDSLGGGYRLAATQWGLPYVYPWDEPEIVNPAIRILRDGVYRPTRYAYGPVNSYVHAAWGMLGVLKAVQNGDIRTVWDLKTDWDTGWYWTVTSPAFHQQARLLSVIMWLITAFAVWRSCQLLESSWGGIVALSMLAFSFMNFEQTSIVTVGALASMFAALSLWAGVFYVVRPCATRQALFWSAIAAAVSVAAKLIFLPMVSVPVIAHLATLARYKGRNNWGIFWAVVGTTVFVLALLMLPALFDPPRFVHSLTTEMAYYTANQQPLGFWRFLRQVMVVLLAGAEAREVYAIGGELCAFSWNFFSFVYVLLALWGLTQMRRRPGAAALIFIPAFLNAWQVSSYQGEFYTRNLMIAQLCWAISAAVGCDALRRSSARFGKMGQEVVTGVVIFLSMLPAVRLWPAVHERLTTTDSRVLAAKELQGESMLGKKVLAAAELHWFIPSGPRADNAKVTQASVTRLLRHPEEAAQFDLLILPAQLATFGGSHRSRDALKEWNNQLTKFSPLKSFGANLTYFDRPTTDPKILFVSPSEFRFRGIRREARRIYGYELYSPPSDTACFLTRDGIAAKDYFRGVTTFTLLRPTKEIVVNARGTNPFEQQDLPQVGLRIFTTTDTAHKKPIASVNIELERTGSGLVDYPVRAEIPAGEYVLHVTTNNPHRRFMTEVQYIEFR